MKFCAYCFLETMFLIPYHSHPQKTWRSLQATKDKKVIIGDDDHRVMAFE